MENTAVTFSVFTKPWKTQSVDELATFVRRTGFDGIEFPLRDGYQAQPGNADTSLPLLAQRMRAHGLAVTSVASVLDERVFAGCAAAGVPLIRIMMGHEPGMNFYEDMRSRLEALEEKQSLCERYGVRVGIQHHYGPGINNSMELQWFLQRLDPNYFGAVWDCAHSALAGEEPEQALDILWPRLFLVNLKNAYYQIPAAGEAPAVPVRRVFTTGDKGLSSWDRVAHALSERGYHGVVCLTAEYSQEDLVDTYIGEDLKLAHSIFIK